MINLILQFFTKLRSAFARGPSWWTTHGGILVHGLTASLKVAIQTELILRVLTVDLGLLRLVEAGPHHLELAHDVHGLLDVQRQRLEGLVDEDLALLERLILRYAVEVSEALVQERGDVLDLLQHLCIVAHVDELHELLEDGLDIVDLFVVRIDDAFLVHETLLFAFILALEFCDDVLFLLFYFSLKFCETVLDIRQLHVHEALELFTHLPK